MGRSTLITISAILALVTLAPRGAAAQRDSDVATPRPSEASAAVAGSQSDITPAAAGIWFGLGVGRGSAALSCGICTTSRDGGPSVSLAFGSHALPNLRVGVEGSRWVRDTGDGDETVYALGLVAHFVPAAWRGAYLLGGTGWSGYVSGPYRYSAPRVSLGVGYDVPMAARMVVGAQLTFDAGWRAAITNESTTVVDRAGLSVIRLSAQIQRR